MRFNTAERGQALLIVLLSMAVVLTIVLSILSFSVTDVTVTTRENEALRAFSAAEAGIENALIASGTLTGSFGQDNFNATIADFAQGTQSFNYPYEVDSGDEATLWFVAHDNNGRITCADATKPCFRGRTIKVCWGKEGASGSVATTPAVEATFYYANTPGNYGTMRIARAAVDPNAGRRTINSFTASDAGSCVVDDKTYAFQKTIDLASLGVPIGSYNVANGLQLAHLRLVYNTDVPHPIGVDASFAGNTPLPSQAKKVESVGTAGEATRKVEVFKFFSDMPSVFEASIFSTGGITK